MHLLVLRGGALGDFLVTLPALRALRAGRPHAEITLVGNRRAAALGMVDGTLHRVLDQQEARWAPLFNGAPLPAALEAWLCTFDQVVNFWPDPDGVLAGHLQRLRLPFVSASPDVAAAPAARHFLRPLEPLVGGSPDLAPTIRWPAEIQQESAARIHALGPDFIALHPGSGGSGKLWPLDHWQQLAARLERPILWIVGEAEPWAAPPAGVRHLAARSWPLPVLGATLSQCRLYLGHDTGVTHLAAAAGARGIALFGPTDPAIWAPPTPRFRVLRGEGGQTSGITLDDVLTAARLLSPPRTPATRSATA